VAARLGCALGDMNFADANPNNALPAGSLIAIALTMTVVLAIWLIMVFRADSSQSKPRAGSQPKVAEPDATSEDKHNGAGQAQAGQREGASA
jgi:hypothetical protein